MSFIVILAFLHVLSVNTAHTCNSRPCVLVADSVGPCLLVAFALYYAVKCSSTASRKKSDSPKNSQIFISFDLNKKEKLIWII